MTASIGFSHLHVPPATSFADGSGVFGAGSAGRAQQFLADSDRGALSQQLLVFAGLPDFSQQLSRAFGFSGAGAGAGGFSGAEQQQPETTFAIAEHEHDVPEHAPGATRVSLARVATGNATAGVN